MKSACNFIAASSRNPESARGVAAGVSNVEIFQATAERVAQLAESVTPAQAQRTVPATPEWSVHDLLAHLTGVTRDFATGQTQDAPSRSWTNRHVHDRRRATTAEIAAELREFAPQLTAEELDKPASAPLWDAIVHEQDLREALALERAPEETWRSILPNLVAKLGHLPALNGFEVTTIENTWRVGIPTTRIDFDGEDYELLRVLFSRRTTVQISTRTLGVEVLEAASIFGPRSV